jgi:hypothetical protein
VPRTAASRAFLAELARRPDFLPHYVYLNVRHCLAIDPSSAAVALGDGRAFRLVPLGDVAAVEGRGRGFGYHLRLDLADGTHWEVRTLISVEPLTTAADLLRLGQARAARGEPGLAPQSLVRGAGFAGSLS